MYSSSIRAWSFPLPNKPVIGAGAVGYFFVHLATYQATISGCHYLSVSLFGAIIGYLLIYYEYDQLE